MAKRIRHKTIYPGVFFFYDDEEKKTDKIYYIRYRRGGRTSPEIEEKIGSAKWEKITASIAAAEKAARMKGDGLSNVEERKVLKTPATEEWTFRKLFDAYQESLPKNFSRKPEKTNFKKLADIHKLRICDITTEHIEKIRKELTQILSPQTIKHVLNIVTRTINYGVKNGIIPQPDTQKLYIRKPQVDNIKTEMMNDEQLEKYLKVLDEEKDQASAAFLRIVLFTGIRKGQMIGMKWEDVNFEKNVLTLQAEYAKDGKTTYIVVTSEVMDIIKAIPKTDSPFIFPGKDGEKRENFRRVATRVKKKAGLPADFRPVHGLRHNFASRLASSGEVDIYTIQRQLTHKSPQMTQRYAHLADEALQRAAAAVKGIMTPKKKAEKDEKKETE